jgi:uncharacterized membrane protein
MQNQLKKIVTMSLFISLCFVGAFIKIPSPTGTVAFDSMPGFIAASILGAGPGAVIGFAGHLLTAANSGFPLTLPVHLFVAVQMAAIMGMYGLIFRKINRILAVAVAIILNGVVAPGLLMLIPGYGAAFFTAMVLPLSVGSLMNVILAFLVFNALEKANAFKRTGLISNEHKIS